MIKIGRINYLEIKEVTEHTYVFREGKHKFEIPKNKISLSKKVGDKIKGFIYSDRNGRLKFIIGRPSAVIGDFAFLKVLDVQKSGAFLDWKIKPDLFVPAEELKKIPNIGDFIPVFIKMDKKFKQIIGTNLIEEYLINADDKIKEREPVELLVYFSGRDRYGVIVNQRYRGILYKNEVIGILHPSFNTKGYVKEIEPGGRIIASLYKNKFQMIDAAEKEILWKLKNSGGMLPIHDKTFPKVIEEQLHMSKRLFKNAIGSLYKKQKIIIMENGIALTPPKN